MKLERKAAEGVWGVKKEVYDRISMSNTRPR